MFSIQLKNFRTSLNLTQKEVAKKLNISRQAYCHYELGDREPNIEIIKKLCIIFSCTADELLEIDTPSAREKITINEEK